jgi:hypothetical protein
MKYQEVFFFLKIKSYESIFIGISFCKIGTKIFISSDCLDSIIIFSFFDQFFLSLNELIFIFEENQEEPGNRKNNACSMIIKV